ncbi:DUF4383 domain-containing protein [Saccharothrix hoggarensis]|uniref:DUF4383 domain-containing protein n=1 Tax=Saccharothrix hoggarensis TaxID=913853 RepID=A0ABW3QZQ5_9PSEU
MTHSTTGRVKVAGLQPAQVLAGLTGLVFLALGVLGLVRTGFGDFAGDPHSTLFGFGVNPLHNVAHLVFGVLGLLMASTSGLARLYGWLLFVSYGALVLWGLALSDVFATNPVSGLGNPLALNTMDNWLHLGLAALGLLIAVLPARRKIVTEEPAEPEQRQIPEPTPETRFDTTRTDRGTGIRDPRADPATQEMPAQRVEPGYNDPRVVEPRREGVQRDERIESMDPTVTPRPTQPVDPATTEKHRMWHPR